MDKYNRPMRIKTGNKWLYHLMALFTACVWGVTYVSTKVLINHGLAPAEILFYRFLLAYITIWIFTPKRLLARSWKDELLFVFAGMAGGSLYFLAENTALKYTLASNVSLILCTAPIFTVFILYLFRKIDRLRRHLLIGSAIALSGVALVVFNGHFVLQISPLGDILSIIAAVMWAFYGLLLKQLDSNYPVLFITRKVFFYGILTLSPYFLFDPIDTSWETLALPAVAGNLLFLGLLASMLCYILWNSAVKELGAVQTATYIYFMPLITLLTSAIVIDEVITPIAMLGSLFIIGGVYFAEKGEKLAPTK
ncbi:DMT family transporter [Parabacteroides sp. OttesenSCG-928-N08]|nr:DMT family transporter [Parabacteroides sp. OttesenSCG-928-N08]